MNELHDVIRTVLTVAAVWIVVSLVGTLVWMAWKSRGRLGR